MANAQPTDMRVSLSAVEPWMLSSPSTQPSKPLVPMHYIGTRRHSHRGIGEQTAPAFVGITLNSRFKARQHNPAHLRKHFGVTFAKRLALRHQSDSQCRFTGLLDPGEIMFEIGGPFIA